MWPVSNGGPPSLFQKGPLWERWDARWWTLVLCQMSLYSLSRRNQHQVNEGRGNSTELLFVPWPHRCYDRHVDQGVGASHLRQLAQWDLVRTRRLKVSYPSIHLYRLEMFGGTLNYERFELKCYICKQLQGSCIQCDFKCCKRSFHVRCAIQEKLIVSNEEMEELRLSTWDIKVFCHQHTKCGK